MISWSFLLGLFICLSEFGLGWMMICYALFFQMFKLRLEQCGTIYVISHLNSNSLGVWFYTPVVMEVIRTFAQWFEWVSEYFANIVYVCVWFWWCSWSTSITDLTMQVNHHDQQDKDGWQARTPWLTSKTKQVDQQDQNNMQHSLCWLPS